MNNPLFSAQVTSVNDIVKTISSNLIFIASEDLDNETIECQDNVPGPNDMCTLLVLSKYSDLVLSMYSDLVLSKYSDLVLSKYSDLVLSMYSYLVLSKYSGLVLSKYSNLVCFDVFL